MDYPGDGNADDIGISGEAGVVCLPKKCSFTKSHQEYVQE